MKHLDILLPFALPPAAAAKALLRECQAPALAILLGKSSPASPERSIDPFARALAHEAWLQRRFDLRDADWTESSPAIACLLMQACGLAAQPGTWFVLQPAHIHIARDHLVLTELRQLELGEVQSRQLFESAALLCEEDGKTLLYGDSRTWFLRADDWQGLRTATPEAASGRNVDIWMPKGPGEKAWRKLQNEMQMQWFAHPLNDEREAAGLPSVNSLWLWGGAQATAAVTATPYPRTFGLSYWMAALARIEDRCAAPPPAEVIHAPEERALLLLDGLLEPGLTDEWGVWLERMELLEREWFVPLLAALRNGSLQSLTLILTGQEKLREVSVSRAALKKFWRSPSLTQLVTVPTTPT
ncbi:hypothetical protein RGU70_12870 [Herbaspirillum sp. RTI4]|uniref:hypothetical protein n=1 Tax=Herbaspirillum sp. RTI4 TaxID=3048640 RepID=UPI002AB465C1|nr:hypothetical protein [Herbaspirillum sp. RTI4]MDY7579213.1 hypothetical protein [Herbaspirillum sp. RTI4]MEA9982654.1 hypothetical protein [Herbaspirillum sp. RTI4]